MRAGRIGRAENRIGQHTGLEDSCLIRSQESDFYFAAGAGIHTAQIAAEPGFGSRNERGIISLQNHGRTNAATASAPVQLEHWHRAFTPRLVDDNPMHREYAVTIGLALFELDPLEAEPLVWPFNRQADSFVKIGHEQRAFADRCTKQNQKGSERRQGKNHPGHRGAVLLDEADLWLEFDFRLEKRRLGGSHGRGRRCGSGLLNRR